MPNPLPETARQKQTEVEAENIELRAALELALKHIYVAPFHARNCPCRRPSEPREYCNCGVRVNAEAKRKIRSLLARRAERQGEDE